MAAGLVSYRCHRWSVRNGFVRIKNLQTQIGYFQLNCILFRSSSPFYESFQRSSDAFVFPCPFRFDDTFKVSDHFLRNISAIFSVPSIFQLLVYYVITLFRFPNSFRISPATVRCFSLFPYISISSVKMHTNAPHFLRISAIFVVLSLVRFM